MVLQKIKGIFAYFYLRLKKIIFGLSTYSRERHWGMAFSYGNAIPKISKETYELLKGNNAFYVMESGEKNCYLTFDCGSDNGNNNAEYILDLLGKRNIRATFFVTQKFIVNFPNVVARMKQDGHIVGNHTTHHPRLTLLTKKKIIQELSVVEKTMKDFTGYDIDKVFRFPFGAYSIRSLNIINRCGYATFFWSFPSPVGKKSRSLQWALGVLGKFHHNRMIMLFHVASQSDRKLLPHYINFLEQLHYSFAPVTVF